MLTGRAWNSAAKISESGFLDFAIGEHDHEASNFLNG